MPTLTNTFALLTVQRNGLWYALFDDGQTELGGPYRTQAELIRDVESIREHLEAKSFAGAK